VILSRRPRSSSRPGWALVALLAACSTTAGGTVAGGPDPGGTGGTDDGAGPATGGGGRSGGTGGRTDADAGTTGGAAGADAAAPEVPDGGPDSAVLEGGGPPGPSVFKHPGVLVDRRALDFIKAKVAAGAEPWKGALEKAKASRFGTLAYAPAPFAVVDCGPYSNPSVGCGEEQRDAIASYTQALLWYLTGDAAHARKSIEVMNAWSAVLKDHTNSNAPLQSAWVASVFPRAAEIIRYTYDGWAPADIARFADMLKTVYLPKVIKGSGGNGNWELSMVEATMGIGVFLEDRDTFDKAIAMWKRRVPSYIYLESDGPQPVPPPSGNKDLISLWYGQDKFVSGLGQETCRDYGHLTGGFAAMVNAAETAHVQGVDLFALEAKRITAGFEFNAQYLDGVPVPAWLCKGALKLGTNDTWEIGYNALANRLGAAMPHTRAVIAKIRPTAANHHMVWESLTHAELDASGGR
jgi:Alginate lyase